MVNTKFESYKLTRELKRSNKEYEFVRSKVNAFGEPINEAMAVGRFKGIYHEENSNIQITEGETIRIRTKKIPMILCLYDDVVSLGLAIDDKTTINSRTFKVTGIVNIQEWNIIADVSLEVVDDGV